MSEAVTGRLDSRLFSSLTRRDFLRVLPAGGLLLAGSTAGCSGADRAFYVEHVLHWDPREILVDVALHVIDSRLEFVDAHCTHCRKAFRFFTEGWVVYGIMTVTCPECSVSVRLATAGTRLLISRLIEEGFDRAVGLATAQGYKVMPEGPVQGRDGPLYVSRSALCDDVQGHEPLELYSRLIPYVPERLVFFTDVRGLSDPTKIHHVWRVDGEVTDRIPLQICYGECGRRFRTYSRKHNLRAGAWIVTAENRRGEVLASKSIVLGG
ncbi:Protein of unknown function [bacterium JGI 053]|nr:Protein of unknown function [bacterium JGI 053]